MEKHPKVIAKRYRLIGEKGEGALSVVYRAHDEVLGRDVALKVLKSGPGLDLQAAQRFDAEARTAARIADPHVAAIYDVIECELGRAIVMEFVDGPSLAERLKIVGALPQATAIGYARQIAQALAAAHAQGVIHRDIKPGNVLLTPSDQVKVVDFGLVKVLDGATSTLTQSGMFVGSVHYVSPEQAQGKALSPASDLYSLGIVIYQMCSGNLPFAGESPLAIALAHITQAAPTRRALEGVMSPGLAGIVERLLQKDPKLRYGNAQEVVTALDALSGDTGAAIPAAGEALDAPTIAAPIPIVPPRKPMTLPAVDRRAAMIAGCAILILLFLIFASRASAVVDNVRGKPAAKARAILADHGFQTTLRTMASTTEPQGIVISQQPQPGTRVRPRTVVQLVASSGAPYVTVPPITGLSLDAARRVLHQLKLQAKVGGVYSYKPPATVVDQAPSPGTRIRQGAGMMVVIAIPPPQPAPYNIGPPGPRRGHGKGKHHGDEGD